MLNQLKVHHRAGIAVALKRAEVKKTRESAKSDVSRLDVEILAKAFAVKSALTYFEIGSFLASLNRRNTVLFESWEMNPNKSKMVKRAL